MALMAFTYYASKANNRVTYATPTINNSTTTEEERTNALSFLDNIQTKNIRVGDIDIAYKIFGKGKPLLLIPGFSATMYIWNPLC